MEPPVGDDFDDVYLNVFPLYEKPSYFQDTTFNNYLSVYLEYLGSELIRQLPGLDPLYVSTLSAGLKNSFNIYSNIGANTADLVAKIRVALHGVTSGSEKPFLVLHFRYHSCDIVVFPDDVSSDHLLFVPMELRRTRFSSAEPVAENGCTRTWRIALPKTIFRVEKTDITDTWLTFLVDFMLNEFPGAYPMGTGRADKLPDSRKNPTPTYILEWLLPEISKNTLPVPDEVLSTKTISSLKKFAGQGNPWRRSTCWNSLRFSTALVQRWCGFSLEQYKVLQLGFKTWLALRYHQRNEPGIQVVKKQAEMMQQIGRRARKLLALNEDLEHIVAFVGSQCDVIQKRTKDFLPSITRQNETENQLPATIDLRSITGRFDLPTAALKSLKEGPNVGMAFLKEDVKPLVSPAEFITDLAANTALELLRAVVRELQTAQVLIAKQKPDLAMFTASSMLHGAEDFIFNLFNCMRSQHVDQDDIGQWAENLASFSASFDHLIRKATTSPEKRSRELLATWCVVVLVDSVSRQNWPELFQGVGVALPVSLLQSATFRERFLMETASNLIAYKKSLGAQPGLFDSDLPRATQEFATRYFDSAEGTSMQDCLLDERQREVERTKTREQELESARLEYERMSELQCKCGWYSGRYWTCHICQKMQSLLDTPTQVIHPLPRDDSTAKEIIFFAAVPTILQYYAAIVHRAYTIHSTELAATNTLDCVAWSISFGLNLEHPSNVTASLRTSCKPLETNSHYRSFSSFVVNVVYPIFRTFVGFGDDDFASIAYDASKYQYQLSGPLASLPWMADASHSENEVLAAQHKMPTTMTKSEFISFGRVRAAPNLQIRELIMALKSLSDKQINNGDFLILTQRVLYEMGPTSPEASCKWIWKRDLFDEYWLTQLHQCLAEKLSHVRQNWQSHATIRLIIEVASFAAQFGHRGNFIRLLEEAKEIICEWVDEVNELIAEFSTQSDLVLKWRLILIQFYSYFLLGSLDITAVQLKHRARLTALKSICGTVPNDINALLDLVNSHTFANTVAIHKLLDQDSAPLDNLVDTTLLEGTEVWNRMQREDGTCVDWYCRGSYMVNPISGLTLRDGFTVSELPSVIAQAPLYQEVMHNASFVVQRVNNEYVSAPIKDRRFKFGFWNHEQQYPFIQELHDDGREFTLLPRQFLQSSNLPAYLINQMAHWIDFNNGVIEFRPIDYRRTDFNYWIRLDSSKCYIKDMKKSQVLNAYDEHLKGLVKVLQRIDAVQNVLCSKPSSDEIKVLYLGYNLTFSVQSNGDILSDNYPGYKLANLQSIPTFPLFTDYLLIEPQSAYSTKLPLILLPYGTQIYPYEFDLVHQRLIPATTLARLILALTYARSSCTLDPLTNTTGYQQAFILLRQCWQNSPYSEQEFKVLCSIMNLSNNSPVVYAIKLLCYHLIQTSEKVLFLHPSQKRNELPDDILEELGEWKKRYLKEKHLLPTDCSLDASTEGDVSLPNVRCKTNGTYFSRVPKIFFSKETIPSQFNIHNFFTVDTKISMLLGDTPTAWLSFTNQVTNEQLFFWFLKQMDQTPQRQLMTKLTFLMHNTLLKNAGGLELLQVLYCTLTMKNYPRPDHRILSQEFVSNKMTVGSGEVKNLTDYKSEDEAWSIYSKRYLSKDYVPTRPFNEIGDCFHFYGKTWRDNFITKLRKMHDNRFIGKLLVDYSNALQSFIKLDGDTCILTEVSTFKSATQLTYTWPKMQLEHHFEFDQINDRCNGFVFFEEKLVQYCRAFNSEAAPAVDIIALRNQQKELETIVQSLFVARNLVEASRHLETLTAITQKIQEIEKSYPLHEFPLKITTTENSKEIQSRIANELNSSYQKHLQSQLATPEIETDISKYEILKAEVDAKRNEAWSKIERILTDLNHPLFKFWHSANLLVKPHPRVIPSLLKKIDREYQMINPCVQSTELLSELAMHFAVLQVHSIKLGRILELLNDLHSLTDESDRQGFESQLFAEISDKREWSPRQYPEWLIFEMERRVCIRSIQVEIATKMLEEKNIVLQLNMGEGKSKVIVPILCSVLANGETLVRVNVLASLFHEVHSYLKLALGNLLGKRIYVFPFKRNVALDKHAMNELRNQLQECKLHGGIILSTPEHRLSMQLKYREVLWQQGQSNDRTGLTPKDFNGVIDIPILELLDESDEILRHKYQLIYTLGDQQLIEGGSSRWNVHLALVRCVIMANLYQMNRDAVATEYLDKDFEGPTRLQDLYDIMSTSTAHLNFNVTPNEPHVLPVVRLIDEGFFAKLRDKIFRVFQLDPVWLRIAKGKSPDELKQVEDFVLNNYPDTPDGDKRCDAFKNKLVLDKSLKVPVLALRGLLSFEVLKTSLMRRHRIHYGIDFSRKVPMAVPFRGKDTPADGVEFGQPDMAITLTVLAHSTGIDLDAVKSCFVYLKSKGINEQREIYRRWYVISKPIMNSKYFTLLEKIEAVNVENVNLMEHLAQYFSRNYEVIAYYLDNFVLPTGTKSFPEKIIANSWDLATSSDKVVGFSGTDDTKHTLPLYVKQVALPSVESTNGKMIDVLTNEKFNNRQYKSLPKEFESERILQEICSHDNWNVLIDSGALIEGMSNREVVVKVLEICPRFETGIFFDESNRLALIDRHGNSSQLNSSRPLEHSCFTYLDDIHTRGTDLPFPTKSHAFVTVATGITKDKLMQACMRMRKLVVGLHNVTFWGTSEVTMKIQQMVQTRGNTTLAENAITSVHILEWVIENTIKAQEEAIITYASQGFHHYAAAMALDLLHSNPSITPSAVIQAIVQQEILATEDMYGIPLKSVNVKDHINQHGTRTKSELLGRVIGQQYKLTEKARDSYQKLINHAAELVPAGKVVHICGSVNEEYERELQQEVEEERQRELPPLVQPIREHSWSFDQICNMKLACNKLLGGVAVLPLKQLFKSTTLQDDWSNNRAFERADIISDIYVTQNFVNTVQSNALSDYIRPIDVVIKFNDVGKTCYLLVSLFEANELLQHVPVKINPKIEFCHLSNMHGTNNDEHRCITLLKLLNGNLSYSKQEKTALMMLLSVVPDKMDFIDQTIAGVELSPDKWHETWNALCRTTVLDKHNGFVEEREDLVPPPGPHNASMIRLITTVLNHSRLFSSKPSKFLHTLLTLRDTIRDYNYSDLHSLFGNF